MSNERKQDINTSNLYSINSNGKNSKYNSNINSMNSNLPINNISIQEIR